MRTDCAVEVGDVATATCMARILAEPQFVSQWSAGGTPGNYSTENMINQLGVPKIN
jgi:hypothetical protein